IDALLINRMGLPTNIRRTPIFGLGCVAGAAGIARAYDYVRAYPTQAAALVSVELCSLTLQREDLSVANLISSGLFADGAAAVIVTGKDFVSSNGNGNGNGGIPGPTILATRSVFYPSTEEMMGWNISEKGFRIILSTEVPSLIRENLGRDVDAFLADNGYQRSDLKSFVLHTGGPKVLDASAAALGLHNGELDASWDCLRKVGNLSSASVLCVLEDVMKHRRPEPGALGLLAAMGPGFCSEPLLLQRFTLTIAEAEARRKILAPSRPAGRGRQAQDADASSRPPARTERKPTRDFPLCANNPRRHPVLRCVVPAQPPKRQAPSVRRCAKRSFLVRSACDHCRPEKRPRPYPNFPGSGLGPP